MYSAIIQWPDEGVRSFLWCGRGVSSCGVHMKDHSAVVGIERGSLQCFLCNTRQKCEHLMCVTEKLQTPPEDPDQPIALKTMYLMLQQHSHQPNPGRRCLSQAPISVLPSSQSKSTSFTGVYICMYIFYHSNHLMFTVTVLVSIYLIYVYMNCHHHDNDIILCYMYVIINSWLSDFTFCLY